MRKVLPLILLVLVSASCKKMMEPIRIPLSGTAWSYSVGDQTARVCFEDENHVSILQTDMTSGAHQSVHGTYDTDGHRVDCQGANWPNSIRFVRTFSHLKNNSTNKNLTPLKTREHASVAGSIWATMEEDNFHFAFFSQDGTCLDGTFANTNHKEGYPIGWKWNRKGYTLSGNKLTAGSFSATLYEDFLITDTLTVMRMAPSVEDKGTSPLAGTVWTYDTAGYPGVIVFNSSNTFTRFLVASRVIFSAINGTYELNGTSLTMDMGGEDGQLKETCQLSADRFTYLEKDYVKVTLP